MPLVLPLHQSKTTTKFARAHHGAHHGLVRRGLQRPSAPSFYRYITTDKFGSIDDEHGGHIANAMRRIVALLTILPAAAGAPLTPRRRTDTGPVDYNPAKGTGCARANTERLEQGKDSDFWDGGFYFEVRAPRGGVCVCACVERGRLVSRPPSVLSSCVPFFRSAWRSQTYVDGWNSQKCTSPPPPSLSIGCSRPALGLCALRADAPCHSPCAQVYYHRLWPRVRFQRYAGSLRKRIDLAAGASLSRFLHCRPFIIQPDSPLWLPPCACVRVPVRLRFAHLHLVCPRARAQPTRATKMSKSCSPKAAPTRSRSV